LPAPPICGRMGRCHNCPRTSAPPSGSGLFIRPHLCVLKQVSNHFLAWCLVSCDAKTPHSYAFLPLLRSQSSSDPPSHYSGLSNLVTCIFFTIWGCLPSVVDQICFPSRCWKSRLKDITDANGHQRMRLGRRTYWGNNVYAS